MQVDTHTSKYIYIIGTMLYGKVRRKQAFSHHIGFVLVVLLFNTCSKYSARIMQNSVILFKTRTCYTSSFIIIPAQCTSCVSNCFSPFLVPFDYMKLFSVQSPELEDGLMVFEVLKIWNLLQNKLKTYPKILTLNQPRQQRFPQHCPGVKPKRKKIL